MEGTQSMAQREAVVAPPDGPSHGKDRAQGSKAGGLIFSRRSAGDEKKGRRHESTFI